MELDCGFTKGNNWFRYRVGAIIIEDGHILFATNDKEDYYYSVGGGVHMNERAEEAILREVYEETGIRYEIDHLAVIHENFFKGDTTANLKGMNCHEISFYYLMKSRGREDIKLECEIGNGAIEKMCWIPIKDLDKYIFYPKFLKEKINDFGKGIIHIVTDDGIK